MKREISKLKREIGRAPRNERGRRRYGQDLRGRVVDLAERWRSEGQPMAKLARELGLRNSLLSEWRRKLPSETRVRSVEVMPDPSSSPAPAALTMKLRGGATIEGLSLEDVASLLREAS